MTAFDAHALTKALGGRWCGHYGIARCPAHDDRTPSLKIRNDPRKADGIDVHCFTGCDWRSVKDEFVRQGLIRPFNANGHDLNRANAAVQSAPPSPTEPEDENDLNQRIEVALNLWKQSVRLNGTLGWRYFTEPRGLHVGLVQIDHVLRWHPGIRAVVALMTDPVSNKPCGIHRTFLNPDATKRKRWMLGNSGVIRLSPDEDVTQCLGITEGVEDALTVLLSGWAPVWAATSAGAITSFPVLGGIEALTIFRDDNEVGVKAAETCAQRWSEAGREVFIASLKELT